MTEPNADKPAHSNVAEEVSDMLGKDHAILDRIQEMRKEELIKVEEREIRMTARGCPSKVLLQRRGFPW